MSQATAIGSYRASASAYGGAAPSAASLQAQLQRYQKLLSDCINCASANTPQGKADIAVIAARIAQLAQRVAELPSSLASAAPPAERAASGVAASVNAGVARTGGASAIDVFA